MMITSNEVKTLAASLGFDACGITRAEPMPEAEERLRLWLREGRHGGMKYLEDFEARAKKFWENFPEAKSVIVVGVNYYSTSNVIASPATFLGGAKQSDALRHPEEARRADEGSRPPEAGPPLAEDPSPLSPASPVPRTQDDECTPSNDGSPKGRVARYAWGKDYHRVIGKRLEAFREKLSEAAGRPVRAEICVDTKPLLERSLAQKAGLGFIGKQSQLLNPRFGPWLFLAELVTDLDLEPDIPYLGSCGSCTICIDECPTQAIRPEGGIDARRCIAYLTIEHKGEIPEALRPLVGDWVFGCDICLQVCPHTSKSREARWPELRPEAGFGEHLDLLKLFQISSNRSYEKKFSGTALTRARRKQLLRNAALVLENLRSETKCPKLEQASKEVSP